MPSGQFGYGRDCLVCFPVCLECKDGYEICTKCKTGLSLYSNKCI